MFSPQNNSRIDTFMLVGTIPMPLERFQNVPIYIYTYMLVPAFRLHYLSPAWVTGCVERPSPSFGDRRIRTSRVRTLVESKQWIKNAYLLLPNLALAIVSIGQTLTGNVTEWDIRSWAGSLLFQWGSSVKLPWVRTVTSRYAFWYDIGCC